MLTRTSIQALDANEEGQIIVTASTPRGSARVTAPSLSRASSTVSTRNLEVDIHASTLDPNRSGLNASTNPKSLGTLPEEGRSSGTGTRPANSQMMITGPPVLTPRGGLQASVSTVSPRNSVPVIRRLGSIGLGSHLGPADGKSSRNSFNSSSFSSFNPEQTDLNPFYSVDESIVRGSENNQLFTSARYFDRNASGGGSLSGPTLYALFCSQARPVPVLLTVGTGESVEAPSGRLQPSQGEKAIPALDLGDTSLRRLSQISLHKRQASGGLLTPGRSGQHTPSGRSEVFTFGESTSNLHSASSLPAMDQSVISPNNEQEPLVLGITYQQLTMLLKFMSVYPSSGDDQVNEWISLIDDGKPEYYKFSAFAQIVDMAVSACNALFELSYPKIPLPCSTQPGANSNVALSQQELQQFQQQHMRIPNEKLSKFIPLSYPPIPQDANKILEEASVSGFKKHCLKWDKEASEAYEQNQTMVPIPDIFVMAPASTLMSTSESKTVAAETYIELFTLAKRSGRSIFLPDLIVDSQVVITRPAPDSSVEFFGHMSRFAGVVYEFDQKGALRTHHVDLLTEKRLRQRARSILGMGLAGTPHASLASLLEECINPLRTYRPKLSAVNSTLNMRSGTRQFVTGPYTLVPSLVLVLNANEPIGRGTSQSNNSALAALIASCASERGVSAYSSPNLALTELTRRIARPSPPTPPGPADPSALEAEATAREAVELKLSKLTDDQSNTERMLEEALTSNAELEHKIVVLEEGLDRAKMEIKNLESRPPAPLIAPDSPKSPDAVTRAHMSALDELSVLTEVCLDFAVSSPIKSGHHNMNASVVTLPETPEASVMNSSFSKSHKQIMQLTPNSNRHFIQPTTPLSLRSTVTPTSILNMSRDKTPLGLPKSPTMSRVGLPISTPFRTQLAALQELERKEVQMQMQKELDARLKEQQEFFLDEQNQQKQQLNEVRNQFALSETKLQNDYFKVQKEHERIVAELKQREIELQADYHLKLTQMQHQMSSLEQMQNRQKEYYEDLLQKERTLQEFTRDEESESGENKKIEFSSLPLSPPREYGVKEIAAKGNKFEGGLKNQYDVQIHRDFKQSTRSPPASVTIYSNYAPLARKLNEILLDEDSNDVVIPGVSRGTNTDEVYNSPFSPPINSATKSKQGRNIYRVQSHIERDEDGIRIDGQNTFNSSSKKGRNSVTQLFPDSNKRKILTSPKGYSRHPGIVYTERNGTLLGPLGPSTLALLHAHDDVKQNPSNKPSFRNNTDQNVRKTIPFSAARAHLKVLSDAARAIRKLNEKSK